MVDSPLRGGVDPSGAALTACCSSLKTIVQSCPFPAVVPRASRSHLKPGSWLVLGECGDQGPSPFSAPVSKRILSSPRAEVPTAVRALRIARREKQWVPQTSLAEGAAVTPDSTGNKMDPGARMFPVCFISAMSSLALQRDSFCFCRWYCSPPKANTQPGALPC